MSDWAERKPPSNGGNLTLDRAGALNVIRTEAQVRPHLGFKPEAVAAATPKARSAGERTLILAVPPAWTETDELPCVPSAKGRLARAHMDRWDTWNQNEADELCVGCPVRSLCLEAAIREERGLSAGGRFMVRGGVTPQGRVRLEKQLGMMGDAS